LISLLDWGTERVARHFAIVDASDYVWHLVYDERQTQWGLSKMWVE